MEVQAVEKKTVKKIKIERKFYPRCSVDKYLNLSFLLSSTIGANAKTRSGICRLFANNSFLRKDFDK